MRFHHLRRFVLCATTSAALACSASVPEPQGLRSLGSGHYVTGAPAGEQGPATASGAAAKPKVVAEFSQPPQTNDWWSSLIWGYRSERPEGRYSEPMFPHPLSMQAGPAGLSIGYTSEPVVSRDGYYFPHRAELLVGVEALAAPDTRVVRYGDWTVTARWQDAEHALDVTAGHGLPFVYATRVHGRARIAPTRGKFTVWKLEGEIAAVAIGGHAYALFAPAGSSWSEAGDALISDLGKHDYFSVAVLPEQSDAALALFRAHAYAFVTDSRVSYGYDAPKARVTTRFELETEQKPGPGTESTPLTSLYRHQWRHTSATFEPGQYASPRGEMKLLAAKSFETSLPCSGILPALPKTEGLDRGRLLGLLKLVTGDELFQPGLEGSRDSYWEGKSFGKIAGLVPIAEQLDEPQLRDRLLDGLKRELEDWFDGRAPRYYYRNDTWRTLIGIPTMYGSGSQLNDHHFHYGYYVLAAATVAEHDRAWAERFAPNVEALIKDAANWDRSDTSFPYLRYFDPYAGHSWATGTTFFETGNNEESSSEDMNFAAAVALWGEVMERPALRDLGLFLYANVTEAVAQYWFDAERAVYPRGFRAPAIGIVWGSGAAYGTWFSPLPESVHGIQLTPMLPGSLWMGRYPERLDQVFRFLLEERGASPAAAQAFERRYQPVIWRDMFWMMLALSHPDASASWFEDEHYFTPDGGNSLAYTYHFIQSLKTLGRLQPGVTADVPLHAVFERAGVHSYAAYNPGTAPRKVAFSDGFELEVPARSEASKSRSVKP